MTDQWGNELTFYQDDTGWNFVRTLDSLKVNYSADVSFDDAQSRAINTMNAMQPQTDA